MSLKTALFLASLVTIVSCKPRSSELLGTLEEQQLSSLSSVITLRYRHSPGAVLTALSPDGKHFATIGRVLGNVGGRAEQLVIWDADSLTSLKQDFPLDSEDRSLDNIEAMKFSPDGKGVAVCGKGALYYWPLNPASSSTPTPKRFPMLRCRSFDFAPDSSVIFAVDAVDNNVYRIDLQQNKRQVILVSKGDKYTAVVALKNLLILARGDRLELRPSDLPEFSAESKSTKHQQVLTFKGSGQVYRNLAYDQKNQIVATTRENQVDYWEISQILQRGSWDQRRYRNLLQLRSKYNADLKSGGLVAAAYGRDVKKVNSRLFEYSDPKKNSYFKRFNFISTEKNKVLVGLQGYSVVLPSGKIGPRRLFFQPLTSLDLGSTLATSLTHHAEKKFLILGLSSGGIKIWRYERHLQPYPVSKGGGAVKGLSIAADSESFFVVRENGSWEQRSIPHNEVVQAGELGGAVIQCVDSAAKPVFACLAKDQVTLRRHSDGAEVVAIPLEGFSPAFVALWNDQVAVADLSGRLRVFDQASGEAVAELNKEVTGGAASLVSGRGATSSYLFMTSALGSTEWLKLNDGKLSKGWLMTGGVPEKRLNRHAYQTWISESGRSLYMTGKVQPKSPTTSVVYANSLLTSAIERGNHQRLSQSKEQFSVGALSSTSGKPDLYTAGTLGRIIKFKFDGAGRTHDLAGPLDALQNFSFLRSNLEVASFDKAGMSQQFATHLAVAPNARFAVVAGRNGSLSIQWLD